MARALEFVFRWASRSGVTPRCVQIAEMTKKSLGVAHYPDAVLVLKFGVDAETEVRGHTRSGTGSFGS
jgi:hypothetical protein